MIFFIFIAIAVVGQVWGDGFVVPSTLKLGAASSAVQTEGAWDVDGKTPSYADLLYTYNVSDASKSYELWKTDVELIKNLGLQIYKFSIPWTRILPNGTSDYVNQVAVDHYNEFIDALVEIGVEPVVTMLHHDLPQCLQQLGGWHNSSFPDWFADYARVLYSNFGDRVKTWLTVNEPIVLCYVHDAKLFGNDTQPNLCNKNLLLGHAKAWRVYDNEFREAQNGQVSLLILDFWFGAESEDDEQLAELVREYFVGIYSNPISSEGDWPEDLKTALANTTSALPDLTSEEIELMKGTSDFFGFNYYSALGVRKAEENETIGAWPLKGSPELGAIMEVTSKCTAFTMALTAQCLYPQGTRDFMNWANKKYNVTRFFLGENGFSNNNKTLYDSERIVYIQDHLQQLSLAIDEDGMDVFGYTAWSLIDSYELGHDDNFGLINVDFTDANRTRTQRDSFYYYQNVIASAKNGSAIELVTNSSSSYELV